MIEATMILSLLFLCLRITLKVHSFINCGTKKLRMLKMVLWNFDIRFILIGKSEAFSVDIKVLFLSDYDSPHMAGAVACSVPNAAAANGTGAFVTFAPHFCQLKSHRQ